MEINEKARYALLFETYQNLLTQSQRQVLHLYLYEDLSITEIATELAFSRQAAHDALKKGLKKLEDIDAKLKER